MDSNSENYKDPEELKKDADTDVQIENPKAEVNTNSTLDINTPSSNDGEVAPEEEFPLANPQESEATPSPEQSKESIDEGDDKGEPISESSILELAYNDEPSARSNDNDNPLGFDDFLASYRKQISDMRRAGRVANGGDDEAIVDEDEEKKEKEESDDEDCAPHFPPMSYREDDDEENEEQDDAVQLSIDPSAVPFVPLKESEKKEQDDEKKYSYDPNKPGFINNLFDILEIFVFTVAIVLFLSSFFFRHSEVDGGSMDITLSHGEHLIISDIFYTPERGDIVVFEDYSLDKKIPIVKRVIGIEGDTVRVENKNGICIVYLNGERLVEDYAFTDDYDMHESGEWEVGSGEVFVLGDHRNVSWDSRSFGTIKSESILGKVILRIYPFDKFGAVD